MLNTLWERQATQRNVALLREPVAAVAGTAAAVLAVTWLAAWMAQRSADRTNLAEVLRLAE